MQYLLLIHDDERNWLDLTDEEQRGVVEEYLALTAELQERGAYVGSNRLAPIATASTVRLREGEEIVTDGPFAETKEHLGGYYLIDVDSLDEALEWAARLPTARRGSIEVRPVMPVPTQASV
jgi:hypothetical protein